MSKLTLDLSDIDERFWREVRRDAYLFQQNEASKNGNHNRELFRLHNAGIERLLRRLDKD